MRVLPLVLIASLLVTGAAPACAWAQSTAQQMLDMAAQIRGNVEKMKDSIPPEARAEMLKSAEQIERAVARGDYAGPVAPPKAPALDEQLMAKYGRLDWLAPLAACAGYTQENYNTFRYSAAINDRDSHCRNAYGHWSTYLRRSRDGDAEGAAQALFYYDAAARRAAALSGGK